MDNATNARIMPTCAPKKNISTKCKTGGKTLTLSHWRALQDCVRLTTHRKMAHNPLWMHVPIGGMVKTMTHSETSITNQDLNNYDYGRE